MTFFYYFVSSFIRRYLDPLAYLTAKTNSLDNLATEILKAAGLTEADVDNMPTFGASTLRPPSVITPTTDLLWPSLSSGENFFDHALVNGQLEGGVELAYVNSDAAAAGHSAPDVWAKEEEVCDEIDPEDGGWEVDADGGEFQTGEGEQTVADEEEGLGAGVTPGPSETFGSGIRHWQLIILQLGRLKQLCRYGFTSVR